MAGLPAELSVIVAVAGIVITFVTPLYYLVLDDRQSRGVAGAERNSLADGLDSLDAKIDEMRNDLHSVQQEVSEVSVRSEINQKHLHDLILEDGNVEDTRLGEPPHSESECPFGSQCPWHGDL